MEPKKKIPKEEKYSTFKLAVHSEIGLNLTPEYKFHPVRKWRFDFCDLEKKIAIEVDGGAFSGGRHTRGAGFIKDCEKINTAQSMGWIVLRFTPSQLNESSTFDMIQTTVNYRNINIA